MNKNDLHKLILRQLREKKLARKGAEAQHPEPVKEPLKEPAKARKTARAKPRVGHNSTDVLNWFHEALLEHYGPESERPAWAAKERTLAKNLLTRYGPEKVKEVVELLVVEWELMCYESGRRLKGPPSISYLYGQRNMLFGELARRKSGKIIKSRGQADEFDHSSGPAKGMGW